MSTHLVNDKRIGVQLPISHHYPIKLFIVRVSNFSCSSRSLSKTSVRQDESLQDTVGIEWGDFVMIRSRTVLKLLIMYLEDWLSTQDGVILLHLMVNFLTLIFPQTFSDLIWYSGILCKEITWSFCRVLDPRAILLSRRVDSSVRFCSSICVIHHMANIL